MDVDWEAVWNQVNTPLRGTPHKHKMSVSTRSTKYFYYFTCDCGVVVVCHKMPFRCLLNGTAMPWADVLYRVWRAL